MPRNDRANGVHHSNAHKGGNGRRKIRAKTLGKKVRSSYRTKRENG